MKKSLVSGLAIASMALLTAGCGLAEVGASAATQGASAAEQAKQAKETEARFQQKLDQANQAGAEQRAKAEEQGQ
jgi:cell division protein FtsX